MMSEKLALLGAGLYADTPGEITLKPFPTATQLDYVSAEEFEQNMLDSILPKCIEEEINCHKLLAIDFQWICRCLRFLNFGPYFTTNMIVCDSCGPIKGEYQVDLRAVDCKPLPEGFTNDIVIKKEDLVDSKDDIHLHLLTIQETLDMRKDKLFVKPNGDINIDLARICYSIHKIGNQADITPVTAKLAVEKLSPADYTILKQEVAELTDFGLRAGGHTVCPVCKSKGAAFFALADDKFFRPTVGDIRKGRDDRNLGWLKNTAGSETETV